MRLNNQILNNLHESARDDWYYLCNEAEQCLFKVKEACKNEEAIKCIERMVIDLNNIRMEQYKALKEYVYDEDGSPELLADNIEHADSDPRFTFSKNNVSNIAKFIEESIHELLNNQSYDGASFKLDDTYAIVVAWEEGFGEEPRDDVYQAKENPDYALCLSIREINPSDSCAYWNIPSDNETGEMLFDSFGIKPGSKSIDLAKDVYEGYLNIIKEEE